MDFKQKYLKYKNKYLSLKNKLQGGTNSINVYDELDQYVKSGTFHRREFKLDDSKNFFLTEFFNKK